MLMPSSVGRQTGFSLIELMIALAIVGIALMLGAPSFSIWMQNTQVRTVSESIQNGLQVTRNEALRRNGRVEFALKTDTSWTVTAKIPGEADVTVEQRAKDEGASANVTATLTPAGGLAVFNGFGRVDNATPLTQVDVQSAVTGTRTLRIQISGGGQIRMCDPDSSIPNTDPRYCL
jgi:type IV fimbrial biogenesis protein FimT